MGLLLALIAAVAAAPAAQGPPFPRIANCYAVDLRPDSTPEDIEEVARFDLLIGGVRCNWADPAEQEKLEAVIAAVRQRNPHIIVLEFSSSAPYAYPNDGTVPEGVWLKQPDGSFIDGWPGTRMLNLTRPGVLEYLGAKTWISIGPRKFDGSFIDCMMGCFDWWACNIESGKPYAVDADEDGKPDDREMLDRQWLEAKTTLVRRLRAEVMPADKVLMANGAGEWALPYLNGILFEDSLDFVIDRGASWERFYRRYLEWTQAPHKPNVTTVVSSSGIEPPFNARQRLSPEEQNALLERGRKLEQRMRFGLASTLMGDGYYAYDLHTRWRGQRWWYKEYDAPLGYPRGEAQRQADGTWRREFDGGTVVVNPTAFDASVKFDAPRLDVSTGKVAAEQVVPFLDGRLLLATDEAPRPGEAPDPQPSFALVGSDPVAKRAERILLRSGNAGAVFDERGGLIELRTARHRITGALGTVLVADESWRDFAYEDCAHRITGEGQIEFTHVRSDGPVRMACRESVAVRANELVVTYRWEALTDGRIYSLRQHVDLPLECYAGATFAAGDATGTLPTELGDSFKIADGIRRLALTPAEGPRVCIEASVDAWLIDERRHGGDGYRLLFSPAKAEVKSGDTWEGTFRIAFD